jgi:hypothetical protein
MLSRDLSPLLHVSLYFASGIGRNVPYIGSIAVVSSRGAQPAFVNIASKHG